MRLGRIWGPRLFGTNYHEVIYEELITSPQEVLSRLCDRISLPFNPSMLSFGEVAKKLVSKSELSWKKETFGPLLPSNKEKWKTELPQREVVLTEFCCKEVFAAGGYKADDRKRRLSLLDMLWVFSGVALVYLAEWPYRAYRQIKLLGSVH